MIPLLQKMKFYSRQDALPRVTRYVSVCLCAVLLGALLTACGGKTQVPRYTSVKTLKTTPVKPKTAQEFARYLSPKTQGLKSWNDMRFALEQSLSYARVRPQDAIAGVLPGEPDTTVTWADIVASLKRMLELLPFLDVNPALLVEEFRWVKITPEFGFTGYYEPTLLADYKKGPVFRYPVYSLPPDMRQGKPYYDRHAIDRKKALAGRGLELAWAKDDVDIFFLQVQGSGRLLFPDGKVKHILYAGKNGHPYVSLGGVLRDEGLIEPDKVSMPSIKACLLKNRDRKEEFLDSNPSYVFFRLANDGPVGGMGRVLTPQVSLAVDPRVLPYGSLLFYSVALPDKKGQHTQPVYALGLPQDTGGAIKGRRIDIFCGAGEWAEHVAGHLNNQGDVYILLPVKGGTHTRDLR